MDPRAPLVLLVALLQACDERRAPAAREPAVTWLPREDECAACHADIADAWARSRHHAAFTNDEFQRAYAREPTPFCRECHAPEHARLPAAEADALGVGCLACHGGLGTVVTAATRSGSDAPHALRRDPAFATRTCARCHEFDFPEGGAQARGTMMQTTMREHAASAHADRSCADCHMPGARHDFASTRDPAAMQRALAVTARRDGDALELELRTRDVGHAFPTGDLFRRLAVHAALVDADGRELARDVRYLARHFVPRHHPDGRLRHAATVPVVDDRIHGAAQVRLELRPAGPADRAELVWQIDLERVDARDPDRPETSTIAGTIRLAEGRLPPITPASSP
ncbi:Cytochrome c554 and c-prime [Nannocystis exedens]|uniref:Cytochrome c554 and c-prime n=1 Tax=Nannocystis exedens TaxID=54 RepID=A0A1I2G541_9BACT|nr:multiheme c-type cytochrome [Nannocystis exedens]PCC67275.1 Doubled CXXCH motif (Paired_CXXCH_1) [Nannocystis exedens]SFF12844.1 Cytochrome c554 and c-prime [Nannocystis exedens]